jgi:hypothetical protein
MDNDAPFSEGDEVIGPHGTGKVVEVRKPTGSSAIEYLMSPRGAEALRATPVPLIVDSIYGPTAYPYVVKFGCGYRDVYARRELDPSNGVNVPCGGPMCGGFAEGGR